MVSFHNFLLSAAGGRKNLSEWRILPVRLFVRRLHCCGNGAAAGKARNGTKGSRATRRFAHVRIFIHVAPQTTPRLRRHEQTRDGVNLRLRRTVCPAAADRGRVGGFVVKLLFWTFLFIVFIFLKFFFLYGVAVPDTGRFDGDGCE